MHQDERAAQGARIDRLAQSLQRGDARILIAVRSGDQRQDRPIMGAAHQRHRNARTRVAQRRNFEVPGYRLPGTRAQRSQLREFIGVRSARNRQEREPAAQKLAHLHGTSFDETWFSAMTHLPSRLRISRVLMPSCGFSGRSSW